MLLRRVMESDGTYLMHNNERLSFTEGFQVGVYLERPTFFLFQEVQSYVIKMMDIDDQIEIIGNIFDMAEYEIMNSIQSGHPIYEDLKMTASQYETMWSVSRNAIDLDNFLPTSWISGTLDAYDENESNKINIFGGIWEDEEDQIHVDASTWVQDLDAALDLGKKYNQISIFDWSIMKCRCTKTGDILEY